MIPKVDFQIHDLLIQIFFFPRLYGGNRDKLKKDFESFTSEFQLREEKILTLIEKFSGLEWMKDRIPAYLVPHNSKVLYSFAHHNLENNLPGIVLKIRGNLFRDMPIFIHELAHINQMQSDFFKEQKIFVFDKEGKRNEDLIELGADIVALYVMREVYGIDSEYEKDFWNFLENTNEKNKRKFEELNKYIGSWDLNVNNLKFYLARDFFK